MKLKWRPLNRTEKLRIMELAGLRIDKSIPHPLVNGFGPYRMYLGDQKVGLCMYDYFDGASINFVWNNHFKTKELLYVRPLVFSITLIIGLCYFLKPVIYNWLVPIGTSVMAGGFAELLELFLESQ